jgi:hypothetical protein
MVSRDRFLKHCDMHHEWGKTAREISDRNSRANKSTNSPYRSATMCRNGLHLMEGANVKFDIQHTGGPRYRYCVACRLAKYKRAVDMTVDQVQAVSRALRTGTTLSQLTQGRPMGGGKTNRGLVVVGTRVFYRHRRENSEFDRFVKDTVAGNTARGQKIRYTRVHTAKVRDNNNDYYNIRDMVSASNPHRDDIVARIFEDLLGGTLKREDVPTRVKAYVAELNKLYPTKYAKFGDSQLVSLDEVLFDQGATTRGDTVSRGLWD